MSRRLSLLFAKRYLLSRKSFSVINIISGISSFTVAIPVMAMVVLLSVFNGFDSLIKSMYQNFDPDIKISASSGRFFDKDSILKTGVGNLEEVKTIAFVAEENALLEFRDRQFIGTIMGVDPLFREVVPIDSMVSIGEFNLKFGDFDQALVGQGMAYNLGMNSLTLNDPISVYIPRRGRTSSVLPMDIYKNKIAFPAGVFALDGETDSKYIIVPLGFVQGLLEYDENMVSSAIIKLRDGADPAKARKAIAELAGDGFKVQTRHQQKESLYRIMQYEKWGIYFIILMVLVIASFSIIGSLVMIIIDKKKDIGTLATMGGNVKFIRRIFITEGLFISGAGAIIGLALGIGICILQQQFGLVKMAGTSFLISSYPVEMKLTDILGVVISAALISYVISWFTVTRMIDKKSII